MFPFPLSFLITPNGEGWKENNGRETIKQSIQASNCLIQAVSAIESNLIFSLRLSFDRSYSSGLKIYLLVNSDSSLSNEDGEELIRFLEKRLAEFYHLKPENSPASTLELDWVGFIGEVYKYEEFIQDKNLYLPYLIEPIQDNDMQSVCNIMRRLDHRAILEITICSCVQNQNFAWIDAVNQMLTQLEKIKHTSASDAALDSALTLYREYQRLYPHGDLVQFSIKAFTEKRSDALLVLQTLVEHAAKPTHHGKQCPIVLIAKGDPRFQQILSATQSVEMTPFHKWQGWQEELGKQYINDAFGSRKGLRELFDDGSMNIHNSSSSSNLIERIGGSTSGSIVSSSGSVLAKFSLVYKPCQIIDLQPLSHLVTLQEISGFFRLPTPTNELPESDSLDLLIKQYGDSIPGDSYIVGIKQDGSPCVSSWENTPHRLIAGVPGSGKTNFIKSVIYQFLHANSQREIWIADFQAGMHYQLIADLHPNLRMVTDLKDFAALLGELWEEHTCRRELMRTHRVTSLTQLKEKTKLELQRRVLIIDEAAFILNAERTVKNEIERHLGNLASMGRTTGIHLVYCSQRPTPEVIPRLISDNMDERVIFKVQSAASVMLIDDDSAASLPVDPKGRAIYKGSDGLKLVVATPYVPDFIWETEL